MFKITYTPTGIKVTATETGSSVSVKHDNGEFIRTNYFSTDEAWLEPAKEIANAGYLGLFIKNFTLRLGKKNTPVAEKIKLMVEALKQYANCTTYRTLNNRLRQHFDDESVLNHKDFRAEFFYEGAWRTGGKPKAVKAAPATKPAAKALKPAVKPAAKKIKTAVAKAVVPATKPAVTKPVASKPKAKKVTAPTPVVAATADTDQAILAAEAEELIQAGAPELVTAGEDEIAVEA